MSDNSQQRPDGAANNTPEFPESAAPSTPGAWPEATPTGSDAPTGYDATGHAPQQPIAGVSPTPAWGVQAPYQAPTNPYDTTAQPTLPLAEAAQPTTPLNPAAAQTHPHGGHTVPSQYGAAFGAPATAQAPSTPVTTEAPSEKPRKKSSAGMFVGAIVAAALVGGAAGLGGAAAGTALWGSSTSAAPAGGGAVTINNPDKVNTVSAVAAKVTPSVVTISATDGQNGGSGSGVVLTEDGYILTNTHVVTLDGETGSATLKVTASDGRIYDATVVGTDPVYDLAVIKLKDASGLTPIEFGNSSKLNVGDQTIAIGAPLGLDNTVTSGIVSALNRSIQIASSAAPQNTDGNSQSDQGQQNNGQGPYQFDLPGQSQQQQTTSSISIAVIQTDAAINPGNSGGALVDSDGKLIGINVAIASAGSSSSSTDQSGNIGVGFSIPSNIAERVSQEIIKTGTATHGLFGATVVSSASDASATIEGALIKEVTAGGAAAGAGLQPGDIVTQFNGVPIASSVDLTAQVRAAAAGSEAKVTYVRGGKQSETTATLGTLK